jgi:hypothetical protein
MNKELERMRTKHSWHNIRYYFGNCLEGLRKTTKKPQSQHSVNQPGSETGIAGQKIIACVNLLCKTKESESIKILHASNFRRNQVYYLQYNGKVA